MSVKLYLIDFSIDGASYGVDMPARDLKHAEELAEAIGGTVLGSDIHSVSAIPPEQLMDFCSAIADEPIRWKFNASEQLGAFLSIGWPNTPRETDD